MKKINQNQKAINKTQIRFRCVKKIVTEYTNLNL